MNRLILFRHAKAVRKATGGDKDRALDKSGRRAAARMGAWMRDEDLRPELALVSDARRTQETFAYAAREFGEPTPVRYEPRIYEAGADALLRLVRMTDPKTNSLLLVGHNPGIAEFAARLTGRGDHAMVARMGLKFPTGAIAQLSCEGSWQELSWGGAGLVRFVTPGSLDTEIEDD
jgi:phosphohistidine phosphatase